MKGSLEYARKLLVPVYYISISIFLTVCTVISPFQSAETERIAYTNNLFSEYKQANQLIYVDETSPVVKQIRESGHEFGKTEYKRFTGMLGLLGCLVVLGLTLLVSFARSTDVIWIGGYFSVLFAIGAMNADFYFGILLSALIAYFIKRRIENKR